MSETLKDKITQERTRVIAVAGASKNEADYNYNKGQANALKWVLKLIEKRIGV